MGHYLIEATYTTQGLQGLMKEGAASRVGAVTKLIESVGGRIECAYWAFGDRDYIAVVELPDNAAAAALALTVAGSGAVGLKTTVLLTAAEVDDARGRRVTYRAPGA